VRRPNGSDDHSVGGELDWWPSVGVRADLDTRDVIPRRRVPWLVDVSLRVSYGTAIRWSPGDVRARFGAGEVERVMPSQREAREWSRGWQENLTAALADGWCPELWREVRS
jgi:hypothetical protein